MFPHHECEIAQSEAANDMTFVRYWIHNNMVTVNGQKMGKSLGNFVTLKDAFKKYHPLTIRFFILSTHYRSPLDFSNEALDAADKGLKRLLNTIKRVRRQIDETANGKTTALVYEKLEEHKKAFLDAMDEDINTSGAIAALFDLSKEMNALLDSGEEVGRKCLEDINSLYQELGGGILGIVPVRKEVKAEKWQDIEDDFSEGDKSALKEVMEVLIDTRNQLRKEKLFKLSDFIRDKLTEIGITLEDTPDATLWKKR